MPRERAKLSAGHRRRRMIIAESKFPTSKIQLVTHFAAQLSTETPGPG